MGEKYNVFFVHSCLTSFFFIGGLRAVIPLERQWALRHQHAHCLSSVSWWTSCWTLYLWLVNFTLGYYNLAIEMFRSMVTFSSKKLKL